MSPWLGAFPSFASLVFQIQHRWRTGSHLLSPFVLADGMLYLNGESTVEAWDIAQGRARWQQPLTKRAAFKPRLTHEAVITSGRGQLAAWNRVDGKPLWDYQPKGELGVPVVYNGRIHLGERHRLLTLDAINGRKIWAFDTAENARIAYAPIGHKDKVLLGPGDGHLYAFSASDGELLWKVDRESDWQYLRQLGIHNDILVAGGYHDELFGINLGDGAIVWRFNAGNFINSQLVAGGKSTSGRLPVGSMHWMPTAV